MKYLPLYYKWMEKGRMPELGLCQSLGCNTVRAFLPDLQHGPMDDENGWYWGYNGEEIEARRAHYHFTPMRQTIVLFLAAMNGEL